MRALIALALGALAIPAQDPTPAAAVVGARVVVDPERPIEDGTVVVRDGRILAVGPRAEVPVPPDAEVVDGRGLTVYAGFIDARSGVGLPATQRTDEQRRAAEGDAVDFARDALAAMESANRKGIRPDLDAALLAAPSEADVRPWHAGGFAAAVVAAGEEYWSGRGAVLSLSGAARRGIVVRARAALHAGFRSYGEGYPTTRMGVLAHMRQTLIDAAHYREQHRLWADRPQGRRPPVDPALDALGDVLDKRLRVFFDAATVEEIGHAFALSDEFGFPIGIAGGDEAWKVAAELKRRAVPVVLSLKWPKEPADDKPGDPDAIREELPPRLREHRKTEWEDRVRNAIRLHEAGVPIAFTARGLAPADVLERLHKLVERGLPRAAAVHALTASPAAMFGTEGQLGRLAAGRPAFLTVLEGEVGDARVKVKHVFADGRKFDVDRKNAPAGIDVTGTWSVRAKDFEATLELKQAGADVTGTARVGTDEGTVTGRVSGRSVTLTSTVAKAAYAFAADLKDGKLAGTVGGPAFKDLEFTATRPE